jgi:hypothetical protein
MENTNIIYRESYFAWDMADLAYRGYRNPNYNWNGFAVPLFDLDVAKVIAKELSNEEISFTYDEEANTFIERQEGDDEQYIIGSQIIEIDGEKKEVFLFGDGWTWMELDYV